MPRSDIDFSLTQRSGEGENKTFVNCLYVWEDALATAFDLSSLSLSRIRTTTQKPLILEESCGHGHDHHHGIGICIEMRQDETRQDETREKINAVFDSPSIHCGK